MGFWNALGSVFGAIQSNKNIDKQLKAQSVENAKIRQYNLDLAKQQNDWNVEQWNNENAYNSPAAQMERLRAAGLNPDMMYGGGVSGNLAASSPDMTAGASATPMDWTALGSKETVLDSALAHAQLEQMDATTDKIKSETEGQDIMNFYAPVEHELGISLTESQVDLNRAQLHKISADITKIQKESENIAADTALKVIQKTFEEKAMQLRLRDLAAKANMSEADAKVALETIMSRVTMSKQQAEKAKHETGKAEYEKLKAKFEKNTQLFDKFLETLGYGLEVYDRWQDFKTKFNVDDAESIDEYFEFDNEGNLKRKHTDRQKGKVNK